MEDGDTVDAISHLALDIGGSLIKMVYFSTSKEQPIDKTKKSASRDSNGMSNGSKDGRLINGRLYFIKFETSKINECLDFISSKQHHYRGYTVLLDTSAPPRADVVKSLKNGITVNLLGMGAAILGMQATVRDSWGQALTTSSNHILTRGITLEVSPVLALDVFSCKGECEHHPVTFFGACVLIGATTLSHATNFRNAREDSPFKVATPTTNSPKPKPTRGRQKRMVQNEEAPRQIAWTTEEEIALLHGKPKKSCTLVNVKWNTRTQMWSVCEVNGHFMRGERRGAGDEDYFNMTLLGYEADTRVYLGKVAARDTRHLGLVCSTTNFWKARDKAKGYMKKKWPRSSGSSSMNDDALARLMAECHDRELAIHESIQRQEDMRFYMQSYDHLTGDALTAMKALMAEIKAKYNLLY
ncbi:pantothenate kinase 2 isoform X1 [Tanacetum coccineum]